MGVLVPGLRDDQRIGKAQFQLFLKKISIGIIMDMGKTYPDELVSQMEQNSERKIHSRLF